MQKQINKKIILLSLLAVIMYCCLEPLFSQVYALYAFSIFAVPYKILRWAVPVIVIGLFLWKLIKEKGNIHYGVMLPIGALFLAYLIPTLLSGENLNVWAETVLMILGYCLFVIALCKNKEYLKIFIRIISWFYFILAAVNLVFAIWPELFSKFTSWTPHAFISTIENQIGFPLVMGFFFCLLDRHFNSKSIVLYLYLPVYLASIWIAWTAAQVIGAFVVVLYFIPQIRKIFEKTNTHLWFGIAIILFVVLVFCWTPIKNLPFVKFLMEDVLHKDVTFTGRLYIWNGIWQMIQENPILGHGLLENPQMIFFDDQYNWNYVHAHNGFLQTWYEAGILSLLCVSAVFIFTGLKCRKMKDRSLIGICNLILFVYLINYEMDEFFMYPWRTCMWCMMIFICNFAVVMTENDN